MQTKPRLLSRFQTEMGSDLEPSTKNSCAERLSCVGLGGAQSSVGGSSCAEKVVGSRERHGGAGRLAQWRSYAAADVCFACALSHAHTHSPQHLWKGHLSRHMPCSRLCLQSGQPYWFERCAALAVLAVLLVCCTRASTYASRQAASRIGMEGLSNHGRLQRACMHARRRESLHAQRGEPLGGHARKARSGRRSKNCDLSTTPVCTTKPSGHKRGLLLPVNAIKYDGRLPWEWLRTGANHPIG